MPKEEWSDTIKVVLLFLLLQAAFWLGMYVASL